MGRKGEFVYTSSRINLRSEHGEIRGLYLLVSLFSTFFRFFLPTLSFAYSNLLMAIDDPQLTRINIFEQMSGFSFWHASSMYTVHVRATPVSWKDIVAAGVQETYALLLLLLLLLVHISIHKKSSWPSSVFSNSAWDFLLFCFFWFD